MKVKVEGHESCNNFQQSDGSGFEGAKDPMGGDVLSELESFNVGFYFFVVKVIPGMGSIGHEGNYTRSIQKVAVASVHSTRGGAKTHERAREREELE